MYIHTYVYAHICILTRNYTHTYVYTNIRIFTQTYTRTYVLYTYVYTSIIILVNRVGSQIAVIFLKVKRLINMIQLARWKEKRHGTVSTLRAYSV